jgi:hypothetical protein
MRAQPLKSHPKSCRTDTAGIGFGQQPSPDEVVNCGQLKLEAISRRGGYGTPAVALAELAY